MILNLKTSLDSRKCSETCLGTNSQSGIVLATEEKEQFVCQETYGLMERVDKKTPLPQLMLWKRFVQCAKEACSQG